MSRLSISILIVILFLAACAGPEETSPATATLSPTVTVPTQTATATPTMTPTPRPTPIPWWEGTDLPADEAAGFYYDRDYLVGFESFEPTTILVDGQELPAVAGLIPEGETVILAVEVTNFSKSQIAVIDE